MAVYAAQVEIMDQGIGRIVDRLESLGILDDTLVMFLSDNGGCAEFLQEDPTLPESRSMGIPGTGTTPDGRRVRVGNDPAVAPGPDDTYASYDVQWANVSNAPFRRHKRWVHEGGISTPFIVHWPAGIARPGLVHEPAQLIDITATCIDVAGARYPTEHNGRAVTPPEGVSLRPLITGEGTVAERPMFWEHEGNRAVRLGRWKLVSEYGKPWELYDMEVDRTELPRSVGGGPQHRCLPVGPVPGVGRALRRAALGDARGPGQVGVHRHAPRRQLHDPRRPRPHRPHAVAYPVEIDTHGARR